MRRLIYRLTQLGHFFQDLGNFFFNFQKRGGEALHQAYKTLVVTNAYSHFYSIFRACFDKCFVEYIYIYIFTISTIVLVT